MLQLTSFPTYTDSLRAFCLLTKMGMAPVRHAEARKGDEKHFGGRTADLGGPAGLLMIPVTWS